MDKLWYKRFQYDCQEETFIPRADGTAADQIIEELHLTNHQGAIAMYETLRKALFIPYLMKRVKRTTKECIACAVSKASKTKEDISINTLGSAPWSAVDCDLLKLPVDLGNKYVLAMTAAVNSQK